MLGHGDFLYTQVLAFLISKELKPPSTAIGAIAVFVIVWLVNPALSGS